MLTPALQSLYDAAVAAHPADRKHAEAAVLAEIAEHFEEVDTAAHKIINALEKGDATAVEEAMRGGEFFYSKTFRDFRRAVQVAIGEVAYDGAGTTENVRTLTVGVAEPFASEPAPELPQQPVAEPLVPAQPPLPLDAPLVLTAVDRLDPSDADGRGDDQVAPQVLSVPGGDHP